jgi:hypothetical protein
VIVTQAEVKQELCQILAELELCSHVSAVNLNPSSRDAGEDIGGKRPPGGIDGREDRHRSEDEDDERVLRSAQHFKRQLAHGRPARHVLRDATAALAAWKRQPAPTGELEYGSPQWKRWVAESPLSDEEVASRYNVSRRYISKVRAQYREAA